MLKFKDHQFKGPFKVLNPSLKKYVEASIKLERCLKYAERKKRNKSLKKFKILDLRSAYIWFGAAIKVVKKFSKVSRQRGYWFMECGVEFLEEVQHEILLDIRKLKREKDACK